MNHSHFHILGALGGTIMTTDLCEGFKAPEALAQAMRQGAQFGTRFPDLNVEAVVKSTQQVEVEAMAHLLTEPRIAVQRKILDAYEPRFNNDRDMSGPGVFAIPTAPR